MAVLATALLIALGVVIVTASATPVELVVPKPIYLNEGRQNIQYEAPQRGESRYQPDLENEYHLFTRANPSVSQPLVLGNWGVLGQSNYNPELWTVVLIHGRTQNATSGPIATMVPAFLEAEPCNAIAVDWSAGSGETADMMNAVYSGESIARFLSWLISTTGGSPSRFHLVGFSLGAQCAGNAGRFMGGQLAYITGLDPAFGQWPESDYKFQPGDARYTEVIHTGAGGLGYPEPLAHVDFYPNGGVNMPGCADQQCDHGRAYFYLTESLTGGPFTGTRCASYEDARESSCVSDDTLVMGGNRPKTGASGIFWLETNASPPFARG